MVKEHLFAEELVGEAGEMVAAQLDPPEDRGLEVNLT